MAFDMYDGVFRAFYDHADNSVDMSFSRSTRKDGLFTYIIDLPGVKKEDVKVKLCEDYINVIATRFISPGDINSKTEYNKKFSIPDGVDLTDIKSRLENGVLYVEMKEMKKNVPVVVDIEVE